MIAADTNPNAPLRRDAAPTRAAWPYLRTPLAIYLVVNLPICGLQAFILLANTPVWMKVASGGVLLLTLVFLARGYVRRLVVDARGARLRGIFRTIDLPWERVRRVGSYTPGGGLGATIYVYITARDEPPMGKWDIDAETIQAQERPGMLAAVEATRRHCAEDAGPRVGAAINHP